MKILFPDSVVLVSDNFKVGQDWEVPIPSFFIINAKDKEKRTILDFSDNELFELTSVLKKVRNAMFEVLNIKDIYILQLEDTMHGFHVWMFPIYEWMNKYDDKLKSIIDIMDYARENMSDSNDIENVKLAAEKIKIYLDNKK